ncbi:MAG TPA: hypothetical protein VF070_21680 [Streptosporangiaceae bacterium]
MRGEDWGPDRQVRADVLLALLCGAVELKPGQAGKIYLDRASIVGMLGFPGVAFKHRLQLNNCYVADGIDLTEATAPTLRLDGCRIGAIHLYGAKINGSLVLSGAYLGGKAERALAADRLTITGNVFCNDGFEACGEVRLPGASIGGQLNLRSARLDGKDGPALTADGLTVTDAMFCDEGFQACGEVRLVGASIRGQLHFTGAYLDGKDGPALTADGLTIPDAMFCRKGFKADGQIRLNDASLGELDLTGAHLDGRGGSALTADRLTVTGNALCHRGFQASGEVRLAAAKILSQLNFTGARLDGKDGPALTADGLTVTGNMYCDEGFQAFGEVRLPGASIGGQLIFSGAHLDGKDGLALYAGSLTVTRDMFCDEAFRADGTVDLTSAEIGALVDEAESWPQTLNLGGLKYDNLTDLPARKRLDWLNRSVCYSPQPFEQLAAYYRRLGHDDQARRVLLAKQRQRQRQRPRWARWWGWLQDALVGYGYAPGRALLLLAGAFAAGWLLFRTRHPVPVGPGPHPVFNAALYTLDVLVPAPALGQASDFDPQGATLAVAAGLHILGWLLAITVIAAITRSFSRT